MIEVLDQLGNRHAAIGHNVFQSRLQLGSFGGIHSYAAAVLLSEQLTQLRAAFGFPKLRQVGVKIEFRELGLGGQRREQFFGRRIATGFGDRKIISLALTKRKSAVQIKATTSTGKRPPATIAVDDAPGHCSTIAWLYAVPFAGFFPCRVILAFQDASASLFERHTSGRFCRSCAHERIHEVGS